MKKFTTYLKMLIASGFLLGITSGQAQSPCSASFLYTVNPGGNTVFSSTSVNTNSATVYNWSIYNYSNNTTAWMSGMNPSYTFSVNGTYLVYLLITNSAPTCSAMAQQTIAITNTATPCGLVASFYDTQGSGGLVNFTNASYGTVPGTTYNWDFGDNTPTSTAVSPSHTYANDGVYSVTLTANNNFTNTCVGTYVQTIKVCSNQPMTASYNYSLNPGGNVTFASTSTGTNASTVYNWYSTNWGTFASGTNLTQTSINYNVNGTYWTQLELVDPVTTCSATATQTIIITNTSTPCGLNAQFNYTQNNGVVSFSDQSGGTVPGTTYFWNFGDNSTSNTASPIHTYSANGLYVVTFMANNNFSNTCTSTITQTITVCSINQIASSFIYTIGSGGNVTFTSTSSNTTPTTFYNWTFYGAGTYSSGVNLTQTAATYTSNGAYNVQLQVISSVPSCSASSLQTVVISNVIPCGLNASFTDTPGTNGLVNFSNTSTGTVPGTTYSWSFGDGSVSTSASPAYSYPANGTYTVTLLATTNASCFSLYSQVVTITNVCTADATFSLSPSGTPQVWNAIPASPGNITAAEWNWGDGSTSPTLYTSHTYSAAGTYSICLSVTVSCGASNYFCGSYAIYRSSEDGQIIQVNVVDPATVGIPQKRYDLASSISPNPGNGLFRLDVSGLKSNSLSLAVYDLTGRQVHGETTAVINENLTKNIELSRLPDGVYYLQLNAGTATWSKKIVIMK